MVNCQIHRVTLSLVQKHFVRYTMVHCQIHRDTLSLAQKHFVRCTMVHCQIHQVILSPMYVCHTHAGMLSYKLRSYLNTQRHMPTTRRYLVSYIKLSSQLHEDDLPLPKKGASHVMSKDSRNLSSYLVVYFPL